MHAVELDVFYFLVSFVAVRVVRFFHCSLEVVHVLWGCFSLSTFHTCRHCLQMIRT